MPNALLVYPEHPPTYWGGNFALEIVGLKAAFPPLGLLTIAAMFPPEYDLRVVDMNLTSLEESDQEWADMVFTSTLVIQQVSLQAVIERCNQAGVPVVAGGPHPTTFHDEIEGVDHFVLDEVEETFPAFLRDLENGRGKAIYREPRKPDVTRTPYPRFDLIDMKHYDIMGVQFSRGCPFDCEFCDITKLYGRVPRTKTPEQMVNEFELLFGLGWRGQVFLVDDNFIGNKRDAMNLLPVLAAWQRARGYPFTLTTEASVNLARMNELMDAMVEAGFDTVFLGIETPNPKALLKTKKPQNISKREENYLMTLNFRPQMDPRILIEGYRRVTATLYDPTLEMFRQARVQDGVEFRNRRHALCTRVQSRYDSIPSEFRYNEDGIEHAMAAFRFAVNAQSERPSAM